MNNENKIKINVSMFFESIIFNLSSRNYYSSIFIYIILQKVKHFKLPMLKSLYIIICRHIKLIQIKKIIKLSWKNLFLNKLSNIIDTFLSS